MQNSLAADTDTLDADRQTQIDTDRHTQTNGYGRRSTNTNNERNEKVMKKSVGRLT